MSNTAAAACCMVVLRATLGVAALSGCAAIEPYERPYVWTATGSDAANLAVMAEAPADLARGRPTDGADGQAATAAVDRLRADRRKPLDVTPTSGLASGGGAGAATN